MQRPRTPTPPAGALRLALPGVLSAWLATACSLVPEPAPGTFPSLPDDLSEPGTARRGWWTDLGDERLDALVSDVLARNFTLDEALATVRESRARAIIDGAERFPSVDAGLTATEQEGAGGAQARRATGMARPRWQSSLSASWEADLWGANRARAEAGQARLRAAKRELAAARQMVIADTVARYAELRAVERRLGLQRELLALARSRLAQTSESYRSGLVSAFELYSVQQQRRDAATAIPRLEARRIALRSALAALAGTYGDSLAGLAHDGPAAVPRPERPPGALLPVNLLGQRPDVAAALARVDAARQAVGIARAARLPSLNLELSVGAGGASAADALDDDVWFGRLMASLVAPLFRGGRLAAREDAAEAGLEAAHARLAQRVVGAAREVETALAQLADAQERARLLQAERELADRSLKVQQQRYASGVGEYLDFLEAGRNLLTTRLALVTARRDAAVAWSDLHRAVGGDWLPARDAVDRRGAAP